MKVKTCCTQQRKVVNSKGQPQSAIQRNSLEIDFDAIAVEGGKGMIGTARPIIPTDEEGPCRETDLKAFKIMRTTVTNAMFRVFVESTGYITDAERYGWSYVFQAENTRNHAHSAVSDAPWWRRIENANWQQLGRPDSNIELRDNHPVVHVSWNDANAFATWAGGRLPLEREWEHAARGGRGDIMFPWGDAEPNDFSFTPCNIWQGRFPDNNTCKDGYETTAPADSFEPNEYGLYNMWQCLGMDSSITQGAITCAGGQRAQEAYAWCKSAERWILSMSSELLLPLPHCGSNRKYA